MTHRAFTLVAAGLAACTAPAADAEKPDRPAVAGRSDLPHAQGRSFASLDEYLRFLEQRGAQDVPWYRKIGPDSYELVSRRGPRAPAVVVSRAELMERFGFER